MILHGIVRHTYSTSLKVVAQMPFDNWYRGDVVGYEQTTGVFVELAFVDA